MSIILFMGSMVFVSMIILVPWRMKRILSFVDPWSAYGESGYQLSQALIAFSRGDLFGVGWEKVYKNIIIYQTPKQILFLQSLPKSWD